MSEYGMSRLEIAWGLPLSAGRELQHCISQRHGSKDMPPNQLDPAPIYDGLAKKWQQKQNLKQG